jgi:hypothetical protein
VTLIGTLLELGAKLPDLWPEYPLVHEGGKNIDLIVETAYPPESFAFELKYERESCGVYQPSAAAGRIAKDIMRLGAVHAHQNRQCMFVLLMDDSAFAALPKSNAALSRMLALPKGKTQEFTWTTLKPEQAYSYLRTLDGVMNPCTIERLSGTERNLSMSLRHRVGGVY